MFYKLKNLKRTSWLGIVLALGALFLLCRIFALQTFGYKEYQDKVQQQLTHEEPVRAKRGTIYDKNGKILATNRTAYDLNVSPAGIEAAAEKANKKMEEQTDFILDGFSAILGDKNYQAEFRDPILKNHNKLYRNIKKSIVDDETLDALLKFIADNDLSTQVYLSATSIRYYPYGTLACHVIGFCSSDGKGLYGLEAQYNDVLAGVDGKVVTARDAYGNEMYYDYESYVSAIDGCDIWTTIDVDIQAVLDEQCEQSLINTGSENGTCGIVMDPATGGILAMSTAPAFDLNEPWKLVDYYQKQLDDYVKENNIAEDSDAYAKMQTDLRNKMWANKAITEAFIPGSTFKIITSAMALENRVVTDVYKTDDRCYCISRDGGRLGNTYVGGVNIHCHSKHDSQSFAEGLMNSCNVTFINVGIDIGAEDFYNAFKAFGYLEKTGIDLPGEGVSIMHKPEDLRIVELATSAFGQNFKITGIQHAAAVNAVVNGGQLFEPFVVDKTVDKNGKTVYSHGVVEVRRVASEQTCELLRTILEECVSGGYGGKNCYVPGYRVAAKTGTSEKVGDDKDLRIGSVMAFAPAEKPVATAFFMCDEPNPEFGSTYGSTVAAPYMQALMEQILPTMGVAAQYSDAEQENVNRYVPDYVGWSRSAIEKWCDIEYEIVGDGDIIRYQSPAAGTAVNKNGAKIYLYTSKSLESENQGTVPDVVGMTAEAATKTMINRGFNIKVYGSEYYKNTLTATVKAQSVKAGTILPKGSLVELYFSSGEGDDEVDYYVPEVEMPEPVG